MLSPRFWTSLFRNAPSCASCSLTLGCIDAYARPSIELCLLFSSVPAIKSWNLGTRSSIPASLSRTFWSLLPPAPRTLAKMTAAIAGLWSFPFLITCSSQLEQYLPTASRHALSIHAALSMSNAACSIFVCLDFFSSIRTSVCRNPSVRNKAEATEGTIGKTAAAAEKARTTSSLECLRSRVVIKAEIPLCPFSPETSKYFAVARIA